MAVEASPSQVLSFLGSRIVSMLDGNPVRNGVPRNERERRIRRRVHVRLGREDDGGVVFKLDTRAIRMFKVAVGGSGGGRDVELVRATHVRLRSEGEVGTVDRKRVGVKRISTRRERRVMLRPEVNIFPVLTDIWESIATHHRIVVPLVVVRVEGRLKVVGSPGDISPGRILTAVLKLGYIRTDGVGVVEFLHERTPRVMVGNLMMRLLPGMVDN